MKSLSRTNFPLRTSFYTLRVEPDIVEPGKPQHKPFAERSVRTLKYECLWLEPPEDWRHGAQHLNLYRHFYKHERANQSLACSNRPPYEAFPVLPTLPQLPEQVDPDAWLKQYHRRVFRRRVGGNGSISVGRHDYYIGHLHSGTQVSVALDAERKVFSILQRSTVLAEKEIQGLVGRVLAFETYLHHMLVEARTLDQA